MLVFSTQLHKGSLLTNGTAVTTNTPLRWSGKRYALLHNGTSHSSTIATTAFGTLPFSVSTLAKVGALGASRSLIGGAANSFELYVSSTGYLTVVKYGGSALTASTTLLKAGIEYVLGYIKSGTTGTYYVNGVAAGTTTDANDYTVASSLIGNGTGFFNGSISSVRIFNHALTASEITAEYNYSLSLRGTNNLIRNIQTIKPTDLSRQKPSLVAAYNMIAQKNVLVDISGNLKNGACTSCINTKDGILLSGVNSKVALGNIGNVKSVSFRFKPNSATCKILEKAANSGLIFNNSGTLSAADFANIYINGVAGTTLVVGQWQNVTLTSVTDVAFTAATLGLNNATYGAFEIADLRFYNKTLSAQEVKDYNNQFIKVLLQANFQSDPADGTSITPVVFIKGTGVGKVLELTAATGGLQKGTKYFQFTTAGTISVPISLESYSAYIDYDYFNGTVWAHRSGLISAPVAGVAYTASKLTITGANIGDAFINLVVKTAIKV